MLTSSLDQGAVKWQAFDPSGDGGRRLRGGCEWRGHRNCRLRNVLLVVHVGDAAGHGRHHDDRGRHTFDGRTEEPLSGDVASKVRAAALAKVSGTVERAESNVDSSAPYEAHIVRSEGTEADVRVSKDFKVTAVNDMGGHHR